MNMYYKHKVLAFSKKMTLGSSAVFHDLLHDIGYVHTDVATLSLHILAIIFANFQKAKGWYDAHSKDQVERVFDVPNIQGVKTGKK